MPVRPQGDPAHRALGCSLLLGHKRAQHRAAVATLVKPYPVPPGDGLPVLGVWVVPAPLRERYGIRAGVCLDACASRHKGVRRMDAAPL
jgi:hypothetical protein